MMTSEQKEAIRTMCALCSRELGLDMDCSNCAVRMLDEPEERIRVSNKEGKPKMKYTLLRSTLEVEVTYKVPMTGKNPPREDMEKELNKLPREIMNDLTGGVLLPDGITLTVREVGRNVWEEEE